MHLIMRQYFTSTIILFALTTFQILLASVDFQVFFLIRYLIELHITRFYWAEKWLLSGMYSQVVKKIVPLSKKLPTAVVITREYLRLPPCRSASIFNHSKLFRTRHMHFVCKGGQINVFAVCKFHRSLFRQFEFLVDSLSNGKAYIRTFLQLFIDFVIVLCTGLTINSIGFQGFLLRG